MSVLGFKPKNGFLKLSSRPLGHYFRDSQINSFILHWNRWRSQVPFSYFNDVNLAENEDSGGWRKVPWLLLSGVLLASLSSPHWPCGQRGRPQKNSADVSWRRCNALTKALCALRCSFDAHASVFPEVQWLVAVHQGEDFELGWLNVRLKYLSIKVIVNDDF